MPICRLCYNAIRRYFRARDYLKCHCHFFIRCDDARPDVCGRGGQELSQPLGRHQMSLGHAVIEVPIILLIYYGFARFFQHNVVQNRVEPHRRAVIIWLGINMFRARKEVAQGGKDLKYGAFTAGIVMTAINPFIYLWWAAVGCDAGDEDYGLRRRLAAGDDCGALAVRPGLADIRFRPDLPHQRFVGTEIAGMDFRGLQPAAGRFRVWYLISGIQKF